MLKTITENQFDVYVLFTRSKYANILAKEIRWFKNDTDTIFGIVLLDNVDNNFTSMLLSRDDNYHIRYKCQEIDFESIKEAEEWIFKESESLEKDSNFVKLQNKFINNKKINIFEPVVNESKLDDYFKILKDKSTHTGAKKLIREIMPYFFDIDGNFIQQFQTTGFDARLWELYLFCYFAEEGLEVIRNGKYYAPDFYLYNGKEYVGLEAVTVGRKNERVNCESNQIENFQDVIENKIPIRFGSALYSKVSHIDKNNGKHYWEFGHTKNRPFVIAIADFHDDLSMTWTSSSLITYLYGYKHNFEYDSNGNLIILPERVETHTFCGKSINSGFFFQEGSEHVSAILFSASGTMSKFNRIGKQCGFDKKNTIMIRNVMCYDPNPNASKPILLSYEVSEKNSEAWGEGITIFHNPNALIPLPQDFFETVTQSYFEDGYIKSDMPNPHVYSSFTAIIVPEDEK